MDSTSASAIFARRRRDQYSQIWDSQRIRRFLAASRSASVISLLKVEVWSIESSSSKSLDRARCVR